MTIRRTLMPSAAAVVVQGLGLLALDGIAYAGSRGRMDAPVSLAERVDVGNVPGAVQVPLVSSGF